MGGKIKPRQQRRPKGQTRDMIPNPKDPNRLPKQKRRDNPRKWGWDNGE